MVRTLKSLSVHWGKAAGGIRTFTHFIKTVIVEVKKVSKERAQWIESGLQKLSEYAREVIKRVPRVVDHAHRKVEQRLQHVTQFSV